MTQVQINAEILKVLRNHALGVGTLAHWSEMAMEWIQRAERRIDELQAKNKPLEPSETKPWRSGAESVLCILKANLPCVPGVETITFTVGQVKDLINLLEQEKGDE